MDNFGRDILDRPDNAQFVMPKSQMDDLLRTTNVDIANIGKELGINPGTWTNQEMVRIDIPNPKELNMRLSSGNELGTNPQWLPGGKLPTGYSEIIIDNIPKGKYIERRLK